MEPLFDAIAQVDLEQQKLRSTGAIENIPANDDYFKNLCRRSRRAEKQASKVIAKARTALHQARYGFDRNEEKTQNALALAQDVTAVCRHARVAYNRLTDALRRLNESSQALVTDPSLPKDLYPTSSAHE